MKNSCPHSVFQKEIAREGIIHRKMIRALIVLLIVVMIIPFPAIADGNQTMSVQVKDAQVRSTPSFMGRLVTTLSYGAKVQVQTEKGDWAKIGPGWIHASALTPKEIVLKAGAADVDRYASGEEVALAGKGFNKQVEGAHKAANPKLDYGWVDRMEGFTVSGDEMRRFIREGDLSPEGGVQ